MPKNTTTTTATTSESLLTTAAEIASAFSTELTKLYELRAQYVQAKERFAKMPKLELLSTEHWEKVKVEINDGIKLIDSNITYFNNQLEHVRKAQAAFAADDPDAIKAAVGDYLKTDAELSLKSMAMFRFDSMDIKQSIDEILQYGHKEE